MKIIGKRFSPAEFAVYADSLNLTRGWHGKFVVLHNTAPPTLAMRPHGFSTQNMTDMADFYENTRHWHAGPHLFLDDNGIWVFSPLTTPGVHSPSWNHLSYGIEQLGDYETDDYTHGRGLLVQQNAVAAIAVLSHCAGIDSHSLRLHKEDPETDHKTCPGRHCANLKSQLMDAVHDYIVQKLP